VDNDCFCSTSVSFVYLIPFSMWWLSRIVFNGSAMDQCELPNDLRACNRIPEGPIQDKQMGKFQVSAKRVVWIKSRIVPDGVSTRPGVVSTPYASPHLGHVSSARTGRATGFTDAQELLFGQYPVLTLLRDRKSIHFEIPGIFRP
jgi:hypothetical protein